VQFSFGMAGSTIGIRILRQKLASRCHGTMRSTNISLGVSCESFHQSLSDECISEIARVKSSLVRDPRIPLGGMKQSFFRRPDNSPLFVSIRVHWWLIMD
jgi:hypothetical protein